MTKKRVISLSLSILLFLSMILSPFGNLILPSVIKANAATATYNGKANLTHIYLSSNYTNEKNYYVSFDGNNDLMSGEVHFWYDSNNPSNPIGGKTVRGKKTQAQYSELKSNNGKYETAYIACNSIGDAIPQSGWTGIPYTLTITTTETTTPTQKIITKNYTVNLNVKQISMYSSYQNIIMNWKETEKKPLFGYFKMNKTYYTDSIAGDFVKNLKDAYKKECCYSIQAKINNNYQQIALYHNVNGVSSYTITYNYNNSFSIENNNNNKKIKIDFAKLGTNSLNIGVIELDGYDGNLIGRGWTYRPKTNNDMFFTTKSVTPGKTVDISNDNICYNSPVIININAIKKDKNGKPIAYRDENSGTNVNGIFDLYYSQCLSTENMKNRIKRSQTTARTCSITVDNSELNENGKIHKIATAKIGFSNGYLKFEPATYATNIHKNFPYVYDSFFRGPIGSYVLVEKCSPQGYAINFNEDNDTNNYITWDFYNYSNRTINATYDDTTNKNKATKDKVSCTYHRLSSNISGSESIKNTPLTEIEFKKATNNDSNNTDIANLPYYSYTKAKYDILYDNNKVCTATVNEDGDFKLSNKTDYATNTLKVTLSGNKIININTDLIKDKIWILKETQPARGYAKNNITYFKYNGTKWVELTKTGSTYSEGNSNNTIIINNNVITDYETPIKVKIDMKKLVDESDSVSDRKNASGAMFNLYYCSLDSVESTSEYFKENLEITTAQTYNSNNVISDNINIIGSYKQRRVNIKSDNIYFIGQFKINEYGNAMINVLNTPYIKGRSYSFINEGGSIISNLPLGYYCLIEVRTPTTKAGDNNTTISYKFSDVSRMYTWIKSDKDGKIYKRPNNDYLESSEIPNYSSNTNLLTNQTFKVTFKPNDNSNKSKPVEKSFTLLKTSNIPVSVKDAEYSVYYSKNQITGSNTTIRNTLINSSNLYAGKFTINDDGKGIVTENNIVHETNITKFKVTNVNNSTIYKECASKGYFYIIETKRAKGYTIHNKITEINISEVNGSTEISYVEPHKFDPLKLSVTKTVNYEPVGMSKEDLAAISPLENTEFTLDFYPEANELSDITNIEPDISIKYKTKYNEAHKRYEIDFRDKNYISNINELTNLSTYIVNGNQVSFPIGIYRITETGASSDKFNLENTTWKDDIGNSINTRNIGLLFKVVDEGSLTEINTSLNTYMYDYNHNIWHTNNISTSINFEKPNNTNNGGFKLKKNKLYISNDANDANNIYNFNIEPFSNIEFKIYPIKESAPIDYINHLIRNNNYFNDKNEILQYDDMLNQYFNCYYKDSNNNIIDKYIAKIKTKSNGEASINNLPVGKYLVVEQYNENVNKGYILSKPFCIKIEKDVVNDYYYNEEPINNTKQDIKSIEFDELSQSQNSHLTFKNQEKANIKDELFISGLKLNTSFIIKSVVMRINNNGTIEPVVKDDLGSLYTKNTKITTNTEESYVNTIIDLGKIDVDKLFTTNNTKFVVYDFIFKYTDSEFNTLLTKETINKLISKVNNNPVTNAITNIDNTRYFGHYDNTDSNQIGKLVSVSTQASDKNSKTKMIYLKDTNINIIDKLNYTNFEPNTKYTSIVKIKDFDTDADLYTVNKSFTTNNSGTGTYSFDDINFNSTIIPENTNKIYVTHDIYLNNKEFISHEDLTDEEKEAQSCVFPRISTRLVTNKLLYLNKSTVNTYNGILCSTPNKNTTITDTVYYINLLPGEYRVTLTLVDENEHTIKNKNNNKLQIAKQFTLTSSNQTDLIEGQFVMELTNVDTRQFVGKKIIAYEQVDYLSDMGYRAIAKEMDVNNKDQSQYFIDTRIVINKTDFNGKLLDNAIFNLYKKDKNNNYVIKEQNIKINSNNISSTIFTFAEPGEYKLVEIKSPSKYALNTDLYFNVKFDAKTLKYKVYKVENGNEIEITDTTTIDDEVLPLITFKDAPLTRLPSAGGEGTTVYIVFGMLLMSCSVLYIYKKKCKV